ncbi:MAG: hypothetical protein NTZ05_19315 [Chloroflexi bacterium]|nr:hypothetical protein [Chloroflexota bacterium]
MNTYRTIIRSRQVTRYVALAVAMLLTSGCFSDVTRAGPTATIPDYKSLLAKAATAEYKVTNSITLKDNGNITSTGQQILYSRPPQHRRDTISDTSDSTFQLVDGAYVCDSRTGSLGCIRVDVPAAWLKLLNDYEANATGDFKGIRQLAGMTAYCYLVQNKTDTDPFRLIEACYSRDGVPLATYIRGGRFESEFVATHYSRSVNDDDFQLPAPVATPTATPGKAGHP